MGCVRKTESPTGSLLQFTLPRKNGVSSFSSDPVFSAEGQVARESNLLPVTEQREGMPSGAATGIFAVKVRRRRNLKDWIPASTGMTDKSEKQDPSATAPCAALPPASLQSSTTLGMTNEEGKLISPHPRPLLEGEGEKLTYKRTSEALRASSSTSSLRSGRPRARVFVG